MGLFDNWPYSDVHQLNLDWILKTVKEVKGKTDEIDTAVEETADNANAALESANNAAQSAEDAHDDLITLRGEISDWNDDVTNLKNQVNTNTQNIAVDSARIDAIISGTTPDANAELIDIRVGADGVTYPTAGDAVRGQVTDLNNALSNSNIFAKNNLPLSYWQQGWWGASSGAYDANHDNTICTKTYIDKDILKIQTDATHKFRLQAWDNGTYQGIWNGNTFVKSNPNYYLNDLNIKTFFDNYPSFDFKIVVYNYEDTTPITVGDSTNVYFIDSEIDNLLPLKDVSDHVNIFDFNDTFYYENRSGTEKYSASYTVDKQNETIIANTPYTTGARYIVAENKILEPGDYILSCYVSGVTHPSTVGYVLVNIGEQPESTLSRYKLKQKRNTQMNVDDNVSEGWVYFKKTIASPTKFRFCVQPAGAPTEQMVISQIMITKTKILTEYRNHEDSFSSVDKYARSVIDNIISPTVYSYENRGERIQLKPQMFNVEQMPYSLPNASTYGKSSKQDFDIYNGILFQLLSDNYVVLVNLQTGEVVGNYEINCGHGNSCQFATELENENDEFPPLYCFNYYVNRVYKNKVTLSGATLEATYILNDIEGERFSGGYDSINNMLISINYAVDSSTTPTDNEMTFSVWNLNNLTDLGGGTYTPELVRKVTLPFIPVIQGCKVFNNRLYVLTGYYPTYNYPVKLYAFDYYGMCTNIIDTFPSGIRTSEGEGVAFPKTDEGYDCYLSTYDFYKILFE